MVTGNPTDPPNPLDPITPEVGFEYPEIATPGFAHLIQTFGMQALVACGEVENPVTRRVAVDLELARHHIGVLELLEAKTQGNLDAEEAEMLSDILHRTRIAFIAAGQIENSRPDPASD